MNRMISTIALVSLLSLGLVVSVSYAGAPMGKGGFMTFNSIDLIGAPVKNSQGGFLGIVNGVTIDSEGHAFAIVNHGDYDLYGPGGANSPVPFAALRISEAKSGMEDVILNTDMEHLDFAPFFDPTQSSNRQTEANIYLYYGLQPYWTESGTCSK
jgi:hypothetical protein